MAKYSKINFHNFNLTLHKKRGHKMQNCFLLLFAKKYNLTTI